MYKRLKECKTLREIFEVIPEEFYEKGSFVISLALFMMIIFETFARYILRHQTLMEMQHYFNLVGYCGIAMAFIWILSRCCKTNTMERKEYFKTHIWEVFFIMFLVVSIISACASGNFMEAYEGHWMRMCGLRTFLMIAGLYICGKNIKKEKYVKILWWMFVIASTAQGTLILTKYMGFYGSYCGGFYNKNHCGYFMCMAIMAAEAVMLYEEKTLFKLIAGALMGWNIWLMIINDTFGAYLAVAMAVIFMAIITFISKKGRKKIILISIGIFVMASIMGEISTGNIGRNFSITGSDIGKITSESEEVGMVGSGRGELWIDAIDAIIRRPLLGYGPDLLTKNVESAGEPHNELLQIGAEEGLLGLIMYIGAIVSLFVNKISNIREEKDKVLGCAGILTAYFVSGMFGVIFFYTAPFFYLVMGIVSCNVKKSVKE